jgi:hypothetical protein
MIHAKLRRPSHSKRGGWKDKVSRFLNENLLNFTSIVQHSLNVKEEMCGASYNVSGHVAQ